VWFLYPFTLAFVRTHWGAGNEKDLRRLGMFLLSTNQYLRRIKVSSGDKPLRGRLGRHESKK